MDRIKITKMICILAAIIIIACSLSKVIQKNSLSLTEYEKLQRFSSKPSEAQIIESEANKTKEAPEGSSMEDEANCSDINPVNSSDLDNKNDEIMSDSPQTGVPVNLSDSKLSGVLLNGDSLIDERVTYAESFYYEPVSENLGRYITGISYPSKDNLLAEEPDISIEQLRYLHILHYDFNGISTEGELICNEAIAQDLVEIFYELYQNEYQLGKVLLIDEYNGDDLASMEDNNTSCFNYRVVEGSTHLSKHAYGLAVDINPLYNPYISYENDNTQKVSPETAIDYADRSKPFAYKIDENDLCYKLFTQYGFVWGGNWNHVKDYQHFQKTLN